MATAADNARLAHDAMLLGLHTCALVIVGGHVRAHQRRVADARATMRAHRQRRDALGRAAGRAL